MEKSLSERYLAAKQSLFMSVLTQTLNPMQAKAVVTTEGPVLILAGAGSGKTTVLVRRVAHIIKYGNAFHASPPDPTEEDVRELENALSLPPDVIERDVLPSFISDPCPPWAMLCITFTNKAAREIRERLFSAFEDETVAQEIWAGTFHSVCLRILRKFLPETGYRDGFTIYDTDDKRMVLSDIMKEFKIDDKKLPLKSVAAEISRQKDELHDPEDMPQNDARMREIARVYAEYQRRLRQFNAIDFDDIIRETVRLLQNSENARSWAQKKFRYVSVDEFQDTNVAQFRLTQLLSGGYRNLMVVGDDDQSIYAFRGATVQNILQFDKETFRDCVTIKLEQNYRSTKTILDAANAVISHNPDRHEKMLWCAAGAGEQITLAKCANQYEEARYITDKITSGVVLGKRRYRDYAVLYRINEMGRSLESGFAKSGIPYRVLGTQRFYDRAEIKDMAAYLCLICNREDTGRLKRIINKPKRKLGDASVSAAETLAEGTGKCLFDVVAHASEYPPLSRTADIMEAFGKLIDSFETDGKRPSEIIAEVFERTGYRQMLVDEGEASQTRIRSVEEFISAAVEYESRAGETCSLQGFLEEIELVSDVDKYDEDADAVVLMTVHSAKGLEFPVVFLAGMEETIFPGSQAQLDPEEMSEERRLAYVALTRAKEKIYVTHAAERTLWGRSVPNPLSRFIDRELPRELITEEENIRSPFAPPHSFYGSYRGSGGNRTSETYRSRGTVRGKARTSERAWDPERTAKANAPRSAGQGGGLECFEPGDKVRHAVFGHGKILSARDMGGDVLYEVEFDDGTVKKLMATFARLTSDSEE